MRAAAAQPRQGRGTSLLLAQLATLDPATPTARERLDAALGPELARRLVLALTSGARRAAQRG
ncbi:MAG: hypothetical protein ACYDCH_13635 [Gaiellaceae bacterium]